MCAYAVVFQTIFSVAVPLVTLFIYLCCTAVIVFTSAGLSLIKVFLESN